MDEVIENPKKLNTVSFRNPFNVVDKMEAIGTIELVDPESKSIVISDFDGVIVSHPLTLRNTAVTSSIIGEDWLQDSENYIKMLVGRDAIFVTNRAYPEVNNVADVGHVLARKFFRNASFFHALSSEFPGITLCTGLDRQFGKEGLPVVGHLGTTEVDAWNRLYTNVLEVARKRVEEGNVDDGILELILVSDTLGTGLRTLYTKLKQVYRETINNYIELGELDHTLTKMKLRVQRLCREMHVSRFLFGEDRFAREVGEFIVNNIDEVEHVRIRRITMPLSRKVGSTIYNMFHSLIGTDKFRQGLIDKHEILEQ